MQIAALLSDLTSLGACPPEAALRLVSVHKTLPGRGGETAAQDASADAGLDSDESLRRANELISLHYGVKVKHVQSGLDPELIEARRDVERVIARLRN